MTKQGLKARTLKNISFNAVAKGLMFGFQAVANIILTRTLGAADYGLVGMANIFMSFFVLFGDMGISNAVIRKEELTDRDIRTGFTVRVFQGVLLALIGVAASPIASRVFHDPQVGMILSVFSLNFVINSFGFIPYAYLNRELRYDRLFIPQVGYALVGAIVSIVLALSGFKHWSLVLATMSSSVAYVILLNVMRPSRIGFSLDMKVAKQFFMYGTNIFLVQFVAYALLNAGNFTIGAVQGAKALGFYSIAATWGGMVNTILTGVISSVLFSTYAKIQNEKKRLLNGFMKVVEFTGSIAVLANFSLFILSKDFLYLVLGHNSEKWFPSLIALRILCGLGIVKSLTVPCYNLLMAVGNTTLPFRATLVAAIVQVALTYPVLRFGGIEGVAALILFSTLIQYYMYLKALAKYLNVRFIDIATNIQPAVFAMLISGLAVFLLTSLIGKLTLSLFFLKIFVILGVFIVCYGFFTKWRFWNELKGVIGIARS